MYTCTFIWYTYIYIHIYISTWIVVRQKGQTEASCCRRIAHVWHSSRCKHGINTCIVTVLQCALQRVAVCVPVSHNWVANVWQSSRCWHSINTWFVMIWISQRDDAMICISERWVGLVRDDSMIWISSRWFGLARDDAVIWIN